MSLPDADPQTPAPIAPVRLDGWKEIAAYLRRSVRTVQRWEALLDLPVHRLHTGKTESIYALPAELDAWLASDRRRDAAAADAAAGESTDHSGEPADEPRGHAWTGRTLGPWARVAVAVGALLALAAVHWAVGLVRARRPEFAAHTASAVSPRPVSTVALDRRTLVLRDASGAETGRYDLPLALPADGDSHWLSRTVAVEDLDADGRPEVVVSPPLAADPMGVVLRGDGSVLTQWSFPPAPVYEGQTSVWSAAVPSLVLVPEPPDGTFYVAANVPDDFGGVVLHVNLAGEVLHQYWNAGYVEAMAQVAGPRGPRLIVGGIHNETRGGSLAVFDGAPTGAAPARRAAYQCRGCPGEGPAAFYVFPPSRLQQRLGCTAAVTAVSRRAAGRMVAQVQLSDSCTRTARVDDFEYGYYQIDEHLTITAASVGNLLPTIHARLVAEGRGGLTPADGWRGPGDLFPVRRWNRATGDWDLVERPGQGR